jgi:3-methyl-2-oxobutanoate hydroxymethyltransferase
MPQQVHVAGGFRATGRTDNEAARVSADAAAVAAAGAFAIVIEGTLEPVAAAITRQIEVPTVGIGASASCDGQVLVIDDLLGLFEDFTPKLCGAGGGDFAGGDGICGGCKSAAVSGRGAGFPGEERVAVLF